MRSKIFFCSLFFCSCAKQSEEPKEVQRPEPLRHSEGELTTYADAINRRMQKNRNEGKFWSANSLMAVLEMPESVRLEVAAIAIEHEKKSIEIAKSFSNFRNRLRDQLEAEGRYTVILDPQPFQNRIETLPPSDAKIKMTMTKLEHGKEKNFYLDSDEFPELIEFDDERRRLEFETIEKCLALKPGAY